jgi:adenosylcobinamide-phosphate synthase
MLLYGQQLVVPAAILLDLLLGDPRWLPHPVVGIGRVVSRLEPLLRKYLGDGRLSGTLLVVLTLSVTVGSAILLLLAAHAVGPLPGLVAAVLLSWSCLAARSLHAESRAVATALGQGDLPEARRRLSFIVGRDTENLDEEGIWRATVETVAENSSDGIVAPLLFLMAGGPVAALAYKAVNTLDSMVGYKNDRYRTFGWASARLDDLLNLIPARLTGLLMVLASAFAGLSPWGAWRILLRDGRNHSSPNSGFPEAAAAGGLGVQLGGTSFYSGTPVEKPTIGDAVAPLSTATYRGVVRLMYGAELLLFLFWLLLTGDLW